MNIYLLSDLHIEFHGDYPLPDKLVDVIVLAGDIHKGSKVLEIAVNFQKECNVPVIMVAGNHEYYGSDFRTRLPSLRRKASQMKDIYVLENDFAVIDGVRFLGCTLWTDFALYGEDSIARSKSMAAQYIADFRVIQYDGRRFRPDDAVTEFNNSYRWLAHELKKPFAGKTVVVTHFLPHLLMTVQN